MSLTLSEFFLNTSKTPPVKCLSNSVRLLTQHLLNTKTAIKLEKVPKKKKEKKKEDKQTFKTKLIVFTARTNM